MPAMKYVKRYNKFSLQTNCRICLTQSVAKKVPLNSRLREDEGPGPLVYEAIELLTNEKLPLTSQYPNTICGMCAQLLKMAYDLIAQYQESKRKLRAQLGDCDEPEVESVGDCLQPPVEIVVGKEKFNINDLLIVEEEDNENVTDFNGFLNNLGKSVSATFVKSDYQKPKLNIEPPLLVIEKLIQVPQSNIDSYIIELNVEDVKRSSLVESAPVDENNESQFLDTPANADVFPNLDDLSDMEKGVVKSALKLKYKCPYCSKPMGSLARAKMHSLVCGKNNSNVVCYVCNATFDLRKNLIKHIKDIHLDQLKHQSSEQTIQRSRLQCHVCEKTLNSSGSLFYHMTKHAGKRYGCKHCNKRFYTRTQARSHIQTHRKETTVVVCPICGKGFHYKSGLFYHMKMHTNDRHLLCSYCPRKFYTRNSVKRHELTHTGGRPYACNFCEKKFRSLGEVRKHELLHTGERPYHCQYCDMGFTQAHNLKVHLMTHSGQYHCNHCRKSFADIEILRFHLKNKHQIEATEIVQEEEVLIQHAHVEKITEQQQQQEEVLTATESIELDDNTFFIPEQFEDDIMVSCDDNALIVRTYELRDQVLVETTDSLNQ